MVSNTNCMLIEAAIMHQIQGYPESQMYGNIVGPVWQRRAWQALW